MSETRIRVVIVDDHAVLRAGLEQLLAGQPDLEVVGTAASGGEAIELVLWSRCSLAEAAGALGVSEGTVKSRLHRARQSLTHVIELDALKEALS